MSFLKIHTTGGIISPGDLEKIALACRHHNCDSIQLGSRQEIYIYCETTEADELKKKLRTVNFLVEKDVQAHANIITSFASVGVYPSTVWVTGDTFFDVLEEFDYQPQLKINITDPSQLLVSQFTGELNFVASHHRNYWFLYINFPGLVERELWPALIYIDEVASLAKRIEEIYLNEQLFHVSDLFDQIGNEIVKNSRAVDKDLRLVTGSIPYYEGMNIMNSLNNSYWLGIYRRNYKFSVDFILDLCDLCAENKIGKVSLTTWKTFLIKDIKEQDRIKWEMLLGKYGINIRHSSIELHWQLPDMDEDLMKLKNKLVQVFNENDIRTYGICFGIRYENRTSYGNVIIEKDREDQIYTVYHTSGFNVLSNALIVVKEKIQEEALAETLQEVCKMFYKQLNGKKENDGPVKIKVLMPTVDLFQCKTCYTIYNEQVGDVVAGVPAGNIFNNLPEEYMCPVCDGPKSDYAKIIEV
jgi:rubredoxin